MQFDGYRGDGGTAGDAGPPPSGAFFDSCFADGDCTSGICVFAQTNLAGYCSQDCGSSACPQGVCGAGPDGKMECLQPCTGDQSDSYVCDGGVPFSCGQVGGSHCDVCGCPDSQSCAPSKQCVAKQNVGGPCMTDDDCTSANCSPRFSVCRVSAGQSCDTTNCDLCIVDTNNPSYSFCSRICQTDTDCSAGGGVCIGNVAMPTVFTCRPGCTSTCPGTLCDHTTGSDPELYCDCASCNTNEAPGGPGISCDEPSACTSADCFEGANNVSVCTSSCTSSSDCGAGFSCVETPCTDGTTGKLRNMFLRLR